MPTVPAASYLLGIPRDDKGANKGFGFVSFENAEEATKAVGEMHLKVACRMQHGTACRSGDIATMSISLRC